MARNDSGWVKELFASSAREVTPAAEFEAVVALYVPFVNDPDTARHCASVLSDIERQRAERFSAERGKHHFQQRRAFRRYCGAAALGSSRNLSEISFKETDKGRPYLEEFPHIWFSFSSCRTGFLGAWSWTHAIGVDFEDRTRNLETVELARELFSEAEAEAVRAAEGQTRTLTFLKLWSLKEAALKSIGEGLPRGLDAFWFALAPRVRIVYAPDDCGGPERFRAHTIEGTDTCAALVLRVEA
ncbi:MAG: 4'-phosphopantetheinyl transferase superfamily protein [Filomicrobium sp.]